MGGVSLDGGIGGLYYSPLQAPAPAASPAVPPAPPGLGDDAIQFSAPAAASYDPGALPWEETAAVDTTIPGLTPEQTEAYLALPPERREALDQLATIFSAEDLGRRGYLGKALVDGGLEPYFQMSAEQQADTRSLGFNIGVGDLGNGVSGKTALDFLKVIGDGTLTAPDLAGTTVLEHLTSLTAGGLDPKFTGQQDLVDGARASNGTVAREMVKDLAHPGRIYQGKDSSTCGSASLEVMLASTSPGDFARIGVGLAKYGQVMLAATETRPEIMLQLSDAGFKGGKDRSPLDNAFQASFHEFALRQDGTASSRPIDLRRPLTSKQLEGLYTAVVPGAKVDQLTDPASRQQAFDHIVKAVEEGLAIPVGVFNGADLKSKGHVITITGAERDAAGTLTSLTYTSNGETKKIPPERFEELRQRMGFSVEPPRESPFELMGRVFADILSRSIGAPIGIANLLSPEQQQAMSQETYRQMGQQWAAIAVERAQHRDASPAAGASAPKAPAGAFGGGDDVEGGFGQGDEVDGGFGGGDDVEGGFGQGDEVDGGFGGGDDVEGGFGRNHGPGGF